METRPTTIDTVTVTYDALSRMVEQTKSGTSTEIVYGPTGAKLALYNGSTLLEAFVPLPAGATAVYTSTSLGTTNKVGYYRHSDWLGSSRFSSTPTRTMYNDLAFAPFGEQYAAAGTTGVTNTSFAGNNGDTNTNLYDAYFREYGIQGRWPSPDPAGVAAVDPSNPQSWNRYAYAGNNPLLYVDPLGLTYPNDCGGICHNFMFIGPDGCTYEVVYFAEPPDPQGNVWTGAEIDLVGCPISRGGGGVGGGGNGGGARGPGSPQPPPCKPSTGQRISLGIQGALNAGIGGYKAVDGFLTALAGVAAAPATDGVSLGVAVPGIYFTISGGGQAATGVFQLGRARTGNGGPETTGEQYAAITSGPFLGLTYLTAGAPPAVAERASNLESALTVGTGLIDSSTVSGFISSAVDAGLTALGIAGTGGCHQ